MRTFVLIAGILLFAGGGCQTARRAQSPSGPVAPSSVWNSPWDGSAATDPQSRVRPVTGMRGMVVSDDGVASEWGAEVLRGGGNAIDAAVATAFALAVTRPHYASLGGGGFMLYCPAPRGGRVSECTAIDYRERAPQATGPQFFGELSKDKPKASQDGALASGVPGVPAGLLYALKKYGTISRDALLTRPIELARKGIRVSSNTESAAAQRWRAMSPEAMRIWGCASAGARSSGETPVSANPGAGGETSMSGDSPAPTLPCPSGTLVRQPDLARVLEAIARDGAAGFYSGANARRLIEGLRAAGGVMTLDDLRDYAPRERKPLFGRFRDAELVTMPPPSAGGTLLLQMFGYVERAGRSGEWLQGAGSARAQHALLSAMGIAYADRAEYFGDPDFVNVPVERLLDEAELDRKWKLFDRDHARLPPPSAELQSAGAGANTTHFSVIDAEGNAVAVTTTVNDNFGSGFVAPGTGVVMNNEMDDFVTQPGKPNLFGLVGSRANWVAPGKRPVSSMSPTIVRDRQGRNRIVIGAQGGPRITTGVFQTLFHRLQFGMSIADAMAFGRVHHQWRPVGALFEKNFWSSELIEALRARGWEMSETNGVGKLQAIERFENGRVWGVPDPRTEGVAVRE